MDDLLKKMDEIDSLLKAGFSLSMSPKVPTMQSGMGTSVPKASTPKIPGVAPTSKKDPIKVAQQLNNPKLKIKDLVKYDANGQWSLSKVEEPKEPKYHILTGGQRVTDEPMSLMQINHRFGGIKRLESAGHKVIPHKQEEKDI